MKRILPVAVAAVWLAAICWLSGCDPRAGADLSPITCWERTCPDGRSGCCVLEPRLPKGHP